MKFFIFPQEITISKNPYIRNYEAAAAHYFEIVQDKKKMRFSRLRMFRLLIQAFRADVYVLNWPENTVRGRFGIIVYFIWYLTISIIRLRQRKIVWMFHNIHPHNYENHWSELLRVILFSKSNLIISHSKEGCEYAKSKAFCPVEFRHHPTTITSYNLWSKNIEEFDFFIWGSIYPYKGIAELLENTKCKISDKRIMIIGKCTDPSLTTRIESNLRKGIQFENRFADSQEIAAYCKKAKYVLFPYIGNSISSSGALIDTLQMDGIPVGPNRGAFADLAAVGCCITYESLEEVFEFPLDNEHRFRLKNDDVKNFINNNTWDAYINWFKKTLENL